MPSQPLIAGSRASTSQRDTGAAQNRKSKTWTDFRDGKSKRATVKFYAVILTSTVVMNALSTMLWRIYVPLATQTQSRILIVLIIFGMIQLVGDIALIKGLPETELATRKMEILSYLWFVINLGLVWAATFVVTKNGQDVAFLFLCQAVAMTSLLVYHVGRWCASRCNNKPDNDHFLSWTMLKRKEKLLVSEDKKQLDSCRAGFVSRAKSLSAALYLIAAGICFVAYPVNSNLTNADGTGHPTCETSDNATWLVLLYAGIVLCVFAAVLYRPSESACELVLKASYVYMMVTFQFPPIVDSIGSTTCSDFKGQAKFAYTSSYATVVFLLSAVSEVISKVKYRRKKAAGANVVGNGAAKAVSL
jgi:hypothetical protein